MNAKSKILIVALAVGAATAIACGSGGTKSDNGSNATAEKAPLVVSSGSAAAPDPNAIADDGIFQVGSQVMPGTYKTVVPSNAMFCSYQRLKGVSGEGSDIITIAVASANDSAMVTIKASDAYFQTDGCGKWSKVG